MVELVDALASGASDRKVVEVRVLFRAPSYARDCERRMPSEARRAKEGWFGELRMAGHSLSTIKAFPKKCDNQNRFLKRRARKCVRDFNEGAIQNNAVVRVSDLGNDRPQADRTTPVPCFGFKVFSNRDHSA